MIRGIQKERADTDRSLETGIEWIVAQQLAPLQEELQRLRRYVEALREKVEPW